MDKADSQHLLDEIIKDGRFPVELIHKAAMEPHMGPLAKLILASEAIALRMAKPWTYKSLAEFGEEYFVTYSGSWWQAYPDIRWEREAVAEFSRAITCNLWYHEEGLLLFVREGDSQFRPARAGDAAYDFVRRLMTDESVGSIKFSAPPSWAYELYLQQANYDAYCLVWHEHEDGVRYREAKKLKANAVIRETQRRGGLPSAYLEDGQLGGVEEISQLRPAFADYLHSDHVVKVVDLYRQVCSILDLSVKQAVDFVEKVILKHSISIYSRDPIGLWSACSARAEMLLDLWQSAEHYDWNIEELDKQWGDLRVKKTSADEILSFARDLRCGGAEIDKLRAEESFESEVERSWPWGAYQTEWLCLLVDAVREHWVKYEPTKPATAPKKDVVVEWLKTKTVRGQPVSHNMAQAIATLIRAEGIPDGPRPKG